MTKDQIIHHLSNVGKVNSFVGLTKIMILEKSNTSYDELARLDWSWVQLDGIKVQYVTQLLFDYFCTKYQILKVYDKQNTLIRLI